MTRVSLQHLECGSVSDGQPDPAVHANAGTALRCLIVEDQVMFLQLLKAMLGAIDGLTISHTATSRQEALEICRRDPPDLLILDLCLPDGDGLDVAHQLAERRPEARLVVLSGQASSFICPSALQPMVQGVVDKTAAFRQLQEVIEACLNHRPARLTTRQGEIFALIGQGLSNREIAAHTSLSLATVETHRKAIARRLGVSGADLVRRASLLGELAGEDG